MDVTLNGDGYTITADDVNGDGLPDFVQSWHDGTSYALSEYENVYINTSSLALLSKIATPQGGTETVTYGQSSTAGVGNYIPQKNIVVKTITTTDPVVGVSGATSYQYDGGRYYFATPYDRKFAGFATVTATDAAGNVTKTYYHTGTGTDTAHGEYADSEAKIGQAYRVENYDASGHLYQVTINKWDSSATAAGTFVFLAQTVTETYDGGATHRDTAQSYTYDPATGNVTQSINWGEVTGADDGTFTDVGTDETVENFTYATPVSGSSVTAAVSDDKRLDQSGTIVSDTTTAYDGLALGSVSLGNATQTSQLVAGAIYASTQKTYDGTGFVLTSKDAVGNVTTYTPDTYELYPATVTDALLHATHYVYDYANGKPLTVTDPNGAITTTAYDGFGRPLTITVPDSTTGAPVLKTAFAYVDTTGAISTHETDYLSSTVESDTYTYYDGLDRQIQTRVSSSIPGTYNASDTGYDALGRVAGTSLPYSSSGSAKTPATTVAAWATLYSYDPMGRTISVANIAGTTATAYSLWNVTMTDPLGKVKTYEYDAYGNLVLVQEHNAGATYNTHYTWDLNKDLLNIRDALNDTRSFTYDDLGQRLTAEDLHAPADTTFGTWIYSYDLAGNVIHTLSPRGMNVAYTYDALNRELTENYTGGAGVEATYTYDACADGIGRVCKVVATSSTTKYTYDLLGNTTSEKDIIAGTTYTTATTYDRQGQISQLTYPDNSLVRYRYGTIAQLIEIDRKEVGGSWTTVMAGFTYSPLGQVTFEKFGNGVTTTNTYNPGMLYRLAHRITTNGTANLQDMSYTYDAVGNVTLLTDASATDNAKTVKYNYDDLYRLTNATATGAVVPANNYAEKYQYNAIGDMTSKTGTSYTYGGSAGSTYANPHAPTKVGAVNYTYDHDGNTVSYGPTSNTWNYKDQMLSTHNGSGTSNYAYDYQGNRISDTVGTAATYYPNKYYQTSATKTDKQIYDGSTLVATVEKTGSATVPYYVHPDTTLGTNVMTDPAGNLAQLLDYYPFGDIHVNEMPTSLDESRKFGSYAYDQSTDLDYAGARYYNAKTGQFLSEDPMFWSAPQSYLMDPQQWNSYAYARNNPVVNVDPSGKFSYPGVESGTTDSAVALDEGVMDSAYASAEDHMSLITGVSSATNLVENGPSMVKAFFSGISSSASTFANPATSDYDRSRIGTSGVINTLLFLSSLISGTPEKEAGGIPEISRSDLPGHVQDVINHLEGNGFTDAPEGYKGGREFRNDRNLLPQQSKGYYKEWDVNPYDKNVDRGSERLVTGQNGEIYHTDTHYGDNSGIPFSKVK